MIKIKHITTYICVSVFIISCNTHTESLYKTQYAINNRLKLSVDSIIIPLDSISLPEYMTNTSYYEDDSLALLYAFNSKTWNIDVFDLNKKIVSNHIHLEREGSNGINNVLTLQSISIDSIFIYDGFNFIFINEEGKILSRTNAYCKKKGYSFFLYYQPASLPFYNSVNKKIYGRYITTKEPFSYADNELFAAYDTQNNTWEIFSPEYPPYIKNNRKRLGRNSWLNAHFTKDRISYSFSALPDIFVYELDKQTVKMSGGESKLMDNRGQFYSGNEKDENAKWRHLLDNPNFDPILYDYYHDIYYRISFGEFISTPDYSNSGHFYKKIVLSVFDNSLQLIYETVLPQFKFNFDGYYISSKGLLIFGNNPLNENIDYEKLVLYCISIKESKNN